MQVDCTDAHEQLQKWNGIRSEWNDKKAEQAEDEYIAPMQLLLTQMEETLCEIHWFLRKTEEKVREIKEENIYEPSDSSRY